MEQTPFKRVGTDKSLAQNGSAVQCPNCHYVRQPQDSIIPEWQCPKCGIAYAKRKAALNKALRIRMVSGQELTIQQIKLYDADMVYRLDALRRAASKNLVGYSSGLGFWGSLEWVAAASLVTGILEQSRANQMAQEGYEQLREAAALSRKIREIAPYVHVYTIDNIQYPEPGLWRAALMEPSYKRELIHFGGDYIFVKSEDKEISLMLDKIEQYEYLAAS